MKKKIVKIFSITLGFSLFWSCISLKEIKYLQGDSKLELSQNGYISNQKEEYKLQIDDILSIQIIARDPNLAALFGSQLTHTNVTQINEESFYINGLTLKSDGSIDIPVVGKIQVVNLNLDQAQSVIENKLYSLCKKDAIFVKIQLTGINYVIIGEVNKPGRYEVYKNQVTLLDAIAQAGDLPITAERKKIKIIRQYPEGKKIISVDITKESILNSPYYYLQPNDILIVDPKPQKSWGIGTNTLNTVGTLLGTAANIFAVIISINTFLKK
ncbi:MAG: polysaccharide biosynthesis/export family protein [Flavobacteriales bacterium AspAUS03]